MKFQIVVTTVVEIDAEGRNYFDEDSTTPEGKLREVVKTFERYPRAAADCYGASTTVAGKVLDK